MRGTIYTCTVQSGRHSYQIIDLHRTVIKLGSQCSSGYVLNRSICTCTFFVSQNSAATLFREGGWLYKFLMWNFLRLLRTKNYWSRLIFSPSYSKYKRGRGVLFSDTVYMLRLAWWSEPLQSWQMTLFRETRRRCPTSPVHLATASPSAVASARPTLPPTASMQNNRWNVLPYNMATTRCDAVT